MHAYISIRNGFNLAQLNHYIVLVYLYIYYRCNVEFVPVYFHQQVQKRIEIRPEKKNEIK